MSSGASARARVLVAAFLVALAMSGAARADDGDPLEPVNRALFEVNEVLDGLVIGPAAELYGLLLPGPVRTGIRNFLDNLRAPVILANDLLQGERDRAGTTLARFMINTTLGFGGFYDLASDLGHPKHSEDFGQTLAVWGVRPGPFLFIPFIGPANTRDAAGRIVDFFVLFPLTGEIPTEANVGRVVVDGIDLRHELDPAIRDVRETSLDPYATFRTAYRQQRESEIRNGASPTGDQAYEDIFNEDLEDALE